LLTKLGNKDENAIFHRKILLNSQVFIALIIGMVERAERNITLLHVEKFAKALNGSFFKDKIIYFD
jgi:hypothetical protein